MRLILPVLLTLSVLVSCQPSHNTIRESQQQAMIDSIVATRMGEISRQAAEDLDRRRSIEVKAKADSIIAARRDSVLKSGKLPDNTAPGGAPIP